MQAYLAHQGVYAQLQEAQVTFLAARQGNWFLQGVYDFKARALAVLAQVFPEPHAALLSGILLGVDSGLPSSLKEAFSATGTSHIITISGQNKPTQ
jgi:competence protein ComEC